MGVCLRGDWDELETHVQSQVACPMQLTGGNSVVRSSDFSQSVGRLHREIWNVGLWIKNLKIPLSKKQTSIYGCMLPWVTHLQPVSCVLVWPGAWVRVEGKEDILGTLFPDSICFHQLEWTDAFFIRLWGNPFLVRISHGSLFVDSSCLITKQEWKPPGLYFTLKIRKENSRYRHFWLSSVQRTGPHGEEGKNITVWLLFDLINVKALHTILTYIMELSIF